jgi:uncharacterized protein YdaU (DUF1376 family)
MGKKRWFRFHVDRWFNGTFGLKPNEITAYLTIICLLYDNEGQIEPDFTVMAKRCGMRPSAFKKSVDTLVSLGKLDIKSGKITNEMVTQELSEISQTRSKLVQNSSQTRSKLVQKSPKNPLKTKTDDPYTYNRIQKTEEREDFSYDFDGVNVSFSNDEIENLSRAYRHVDVRKKLAEESFIKWAISQDPSQPKNVICKWFLSKSRASALEEKSKGGFEKLSIDVGSIIQ